MPHAKLTTATTIAGQYSLRSSVKLAKQWPDRSGTLRTSSATPPRGNTTTATTVTATVTDPLGCGPCAWAPSLLMLDKSQSRPQPPPATSRPQPAWLCRGEGFVPAPHAPYCQGAVLSLDRRLCRFGAGLERASRSRDATALLDERCSTTEAVWVRRPIGGGRVHTRATTPSWRTDAPHWQWLSREGCAPNPCTCWCCGSRS